MGDVVSFAALQLRLHPAASRIEKLACETPAQLMLFDCLQEGPDNLTHAPLSARRAALERFMTKAAGERLLLSPFTSGCRDAEQWLAASGGAEHLREVGIGGERALDDGGAVGADEVEAGRGHQREIEGRGQKPLICNRLSSCPGSDICGVGAGALMHRGK